MSSAHDVSRQSGTGRTTAAGVASALAIQAGLMISGIIAARSLGPVDRGLLALVTIVPFITWQLGSLGFPLSTTYAIARNRSALLPVADVTRRVTLVQVAVLVPLTGAISYAIVRGHGSDAVLAAGIALGMVPTHLIHRYSLAIFQGLGKLVAFYVLLVLPIGFWVITLAGLALAGALDLTTATAAYVVSIAASAALALWAARREVQRAPATEGAEAPSLGWMARYGLKGLLGAAPVIQTYRLDQAIVALFLSATSLGYYVVASGLANLPRFIAKSIGMMAFPDTTRQTSAHAAKRTIWRYSWLALLAYGSVAAALFGLAPVLVPLFFGDAFDDAIPVVRVLLLASLLASAQRVLIDGALGLGSPGLASLSELSLLAALAPAAAVLIGEGPEGVAWALVLATAVGLITVAVGVVMARPGEGREPAASQSAELAASSGG